MTPSPTTSPETPVEHLEWIRTAQTQLDDETEIQSLFQAIGYEDGLTFTMTEHPTTDPIAQHFDLLAAHLNALAAATGAPIEDVAADAISTAHSLDEHGAWDGLELTNTNEDEPPAFCPSCARPQENAAPNADETTTFTEHEPGHWTCNTCGSER